ncbi:BrnT family toxin [uncultured Varibaculum sp.]|uniref:BrnT family toxin n=1 Tax=uncultured Varibaculum sp. TaxID=413896 RepID=UPI002597A5B1|nr:BrnT family toxin [uncultured Varibaculum sp.]
MKFEYDPRKGEANLFKHGISFAQSQKLWTEGKTVTFNSNNAGNDESRQITIGIIEGKYYSAITTQRAGRTRIISVRRARQKEIEIYEQNI